MTAAPKRGRPPLPERERRGVSILIDLRDEEREELRAHAATADQPLAVWARETLLRAARG